ncbi:MAG: HAMP domain-containing sensor histidine kinase, partial [Pseudomonadota bacterium]
AGPDMRFLVRETPQGNIVLGESVEREENLRSILAGGMQITLLITLIASFAFSMAIAKRSQQRLDTISKGLKEVAAGHLDTEILLGGTDDDLGMLVERINDTTARLARTMQQIRVQSSNIAHDLRTPLARLRAQLESSLDSLALKQQPVSQATLEDAIAQIDDIAEIFDALLRLAKIQNGEGRARFETVDLAEFVREIADTYGPVVSDAGQKLLVTIDDANEISGDPKLLMQLVANLVQNAMRYGEKGQEINLVVHASKLSITDKGPGIPPQDRAKVLQALYQGETTRNGNGYGLGLAMVKAICDLHKAQLSLGSGPNEVGLTVAVQFPKQAHQ